MNNHRRRLNILVPRSMIITAAAVASITGLCGCAGSSGETAAAKPTSSATATPTAPATGPGGPVRRAVAPAPSRRPGQSAALGRRTKTSGCLARGQLPDPACTPGGVFPNATVAEICRSGYAERVRRVLPATKDAVYAAYGIRSRTDGQYEIDHLVPLEVAGNNTRANLWPEKAPGYAAKDAVENELHAAVCSRRVALRTAQARIAHDWRRAGVAVPPPATTRSLPAPAPRSPAATAPAFCASHRCIAGFSTGRGTIVRCADGEYSHSGGRPGVCSRHGGTQIARR